MGPRLAWNHDKNVMIPGWHWNWGDHDDDDDDAEVSSDTASEAESSITSLIKNRCEAHNYELTEYINDVNLENTQVLMEYDQNGSISTYTYGVQRLSVDTKCTTNYYMYDGRGSVTSIASMSGYVTQSYSYDPFGELTSQTKAYGDIYAYNGESYNTNIGLEYLRARYYDTSIGRFISEDSVLGDIKQPLTLNRYAYTANNPVNYMDPSGHFFKEIFSIVTGIGESVLGGANSVTKGKGLSGFSVGFKSGMEIGSAMGEIKDKEVVYKLTVLLPAAMAQTKRNICEGLSKIK